MTDEQKEKKRLYDIEWRKKNPDKIKQYNTKQYNINKEREKETRKIYYATHIEEIKTKKRAKRELLKDIIFKYYGDKCVCCGEKNRKFLTIDHVNNDGYIHRKNGGDYGSTGKMLSNIIKNGFPKSFQLLCYNCNMGRSHNNGICPHKEI